MAFWDNEADEPSRARCDKLYSISAKIILKKYGKITRAKHAEILDQIMKLMKERSA